MPGAALRYDFTGNYELGPVYISTPNSSLHRQWLYAGNQYLADKGAHVRVEKWIELNGPRTPLWSKFSGPFWTKFRDTATSTTYCVLHNKWPLYQIMGGIYDTGDNFIDDISANVSVYIWWTGTDGRFQFHKDEDIKLYAFIGDINLSDPFASDQWGLGVYDSTTVFEDYGGFGAGSTFSITDDISFTRDRPDNAAKYPDHAPGAFGTHPQIWAGDGITTSSRPKFQLWDASQSYQGSGTFMVQLWNDNQHQVNAIGVRKYDGVSDGDPVWKNGPAIEFQFTPVGKWVWYTPPINIPPPWPRPRSPIPTPPSPPIPPPNQPWPFIPRPWNPDPTPCFVGDTQISLPGNKTKSIEDIKIGDEVVICNTETNEQSTSKVTDVSVHPDTEKYLLINDELKVTSNHLLYDGGNWRSAGDYRIHDDIQYVDGTYKDVKNIKTVYKNVTTYNLEVESIHHNFYANGYLAHNSKVWVGTCDLQKALRYRRYFYHPYGCDPYVEPPSPPGTTTAMLSCAGCLPCSITSKPWVELKINSGGQPEKVHVCNTFSTPASSSTSSILMYIYAPVKHYDYRSTKIVFWGGIDENGAIVSLSDPIYTDYIHTADDAGTDLMMTMPVHERQAPTETVVDAFSAYSIYARVINRTDENVDALVSELIDVPDKDDFREEMATWWCKDRLGTIEFNPVTRKFRNVQLTSYQFKSLTRTLTAANYSDGTSYSMLYLPSNGVHIFKPLELEDGSQFIGWKQQGAGFPADSTVCYDTEWQPVNWNILGYGGLSAGDLGIRGPNLNQSPNYVPTSNFHFLTGYYQGLRYGDWSLSIGKSQPTRPRTRMPVATTSIGLDHHDHHPRRFNVFNAPSVRLEPLSGYVFPKTTLCPVSGYQFYITPAKYPNSCAPAVTADRMYAEMQGNGWHIADFTQFTALSSIEFALFLNEMGRFSEFTPLSSAQYFIDLVGFCTYQGSLTSSDGKYYCLGVTRGKVPSWCTPVSGIGNFHGNDISNFAVCVSGCDLILPYITYKET